MYWEIFVFAEPFEEYGLTVEQQLVPADLDGTDAYLQVVAVGYATSRGQRDGQPVR